MADFTEFPQLSYNQQEVANRGWGIAVSGPGDDRLIVGFYWRSIINQFKSREAGKPTYEDHAYVKIQHPGETQNIVDRPVKQEDKMRWPRQWGMFEQGRHQVPDGIPITLLFPSNPAIAATLRGYNIHTVEQLANLSAQGIQTVGLGAQEWVNAAKKYVEHAEKGVSHHKFETELAAMRAELVKRDRQIAELTQLIHAKSQQAPNPQTYDFQTAQINASHQSEDIPFTPEDANFVHDLSGQAQKKRGGRPKGSKNKQKEPIDGTSN